MIICSNDERKEGRKHRNQQITKEGRYLVVIIILLHNDLLEKKELLLLI